MPPWRKQGALLCFSASMWAAATPFKPFAAESRVQPCAVVSRLIPGHSSVTGMLCYEDRRPSSLCQVPVPRGGDPVRYSTSQIALHVCRFTPTRKCPGQVLVSKGQIQSNPRLHRHFALHVCRFAPTRKCSQILKFIDCTSRLQVRTNEEMSRAGSVPNNLGSDAQHPGKQSLSFTVTTGESLQQLLAERRGTAAAAVDDFAAGMQSPRQVTL